jgi:site-specific recombinase XerD
MITKDGNKWKLDFRPEGSTGRRIIRLFNTKGEALYFQRQTLAEKQAIERSDNRTLTDLINTWYDLHGQSLKSAQDTKNRLLKLTIALDNPIASSVNPEILAQYRKNRLEQGVNPATLNRELVTLKAVYRELKRLSVINYNSAILDVRKLRETKTELSYLTREQLTKLIHQINQSKNDSLPYVVKICLATGARWSEAEKLTHNNCINQGFQFVDTKNGQSRFIPVDDHIFLEVQNRLKQHDFKSCYSAFRSAFDRSGLIVPTGQLAHILRHTFASHFVMNGGNIIALQKILGHSSLNITMRYSHLAPDYLIQAVQLNPLAIIQDGKKLERKQSDIKKPLDYKI